MARVANVPFLLWIPHTFAHVALTAWALAMAGLLRRLWRAFRS